jgi:cyclophilin family peptidyl-prolyl cis-trans isomerase
MRRPGSQDCASPASFADHTDKGFWSIHLYSTSSPVTEQLLIVGIRHWMYNRLAIERAVPNVTARETCSSVRLLSI